MADRARHAFGNLEGVDSALQSGTIDAYDILFLDGETNPKVGWIDKNGVFRLVENNVDTEEIMKVVDAKIEDAMNVIEVVEF